MIYTRIFGTTESVSYGSPGIAEGDNSILYCFVKSACVLRLERTAGSFAASCSVECSLDGTSYGAAYSFAFGDVVEADITGLLRPLLDREMPTGTPAAAGTGSGNVVVTFYDDAGSVVASHMFRIAIVDGIGMAFDNNGLRPRWPAEIVLGSDLPGCPVTLPSMDIGSGSRTVEVGGVSIDNCGLSATVLARPGTTLELESDGDVIASARMVSPSCDSQSLTLVWWSPELGGYKSWAFDVVGEGMSAESLSDFVRDFSRGRASDGSIWLSLRAQQIDIAQWEYLRDILASDEVMMSAPVATSAESVEDDWLHLIAEGDPGEWRLSDRKDFSLRVIAREVAGLW